MDNKPAHPLAFVIRALLRDFLATIAFLLIFEITGRLAVAVGWAIAIGVTQLALRLWKKEPVDRMQWMSLFLVVAFGGASLLTGNYFFFRLKFTLIYAALGLATIFPGWMNAYVSPNARLHAVAITTAFGFIWSGLFFVIAAVNLALAMLAKPAAWAWFIGVFPMASKLLLACAQYLVTRHAVRQGRLTPPAKERDYGFFASNMPKPALLMRVGTVHEAEADRAADRGHEDRPGDVGGSDP